MSPFPRLALIILLTKVVLIIIVFSSCSREEEEQHQVIWYNQPAGEWEEALPVGNGRIGAMVFGLTTEERIQLNDDSLWPAEMGWDEAPGTEEDLEVIRQLLIEGKAAEADKLIVEKFSRKDISKSHQTLGELFLELNHDNITEYRRELNLNNALTEVSYKTNGHLVQQQLFASHPHQAIIIRLTTQAPEGLNGKIRLTRPMDAGVPTVMVSTPANDHIVMAGEVTQRRGVFDSKPFPVTQGVKFETLLRVIPSSGESVAGDGYLELKGAREVMLQLVSNSSWYHENYEQQNFKELAALEGKTFDRLLDEHTEDHRQLFSRVGLQLADNDLDTLPTDERIQRVKNGQQDLALESMLFQYGRYLLIASSRPGTNPANLQGLWNQHIEAPWNADYHFNINLQMNYWLADVTNLGELNQPLFDYVDRVLEKGEVAAMKNFGCRGSFVPHASDLWGATFLQARTAYWGSSFGAGGWLVQHYWHHFEFTRDTTFLQQRALPALHQVAQFYSDWLIEDPRDGSLVAAPSTSPENQYFNQQGGAVALCMGSAIDQQIVAEVFDNYIQTCRILDIENELLSKIVLQRAQLREGFVIGSDGRILEWDREYAEPEPGHRHMSHLYGFHPGTAVTKSKHPELFDAVRKTLDYRLANGGAGTGWSRAWLINYAARLMDGDMAHEHIRFFITNSMYNNLFCSHPPFQIDGNFGFTAGIAEMLLQSHEEGIIRILPALPSSWKNGSVKGLVARGASEMDIVWKEGKLDYFVIHSNGEEKKDIIYNDKVISLDIMPGSTNITLDDQRWREI